MKTIGVIGLGSIGMRHAKNLRDLGHHVWGYDPDMKRRLELGFDFTSSTLDGLSSADGWIIASPTSEHLDHLVMAVLAGKPCLIEKPIASWMGKPPRNLAGALHVAERDKIPLMVGYNLRFHSCVKKSKEWLDAGLLGKPLWANFTLGQYSEKPPYLRDGVILNWSHELDLAIYLLGKAEVAASSTHLTDGKDDLSDILITHESGCHSTVHLDYLTKLENRHFQIVGSLGYIYADLLIRSAVFYPNEGEKIVFYGTDAWNDNYIEEMEAFISRINGKETIGCTGAEGLEVLKICLEVRKQAGLE